jgi:hypothetical protein
MGHTSTLQEVSTGPGTMGHTSTFQEDFCNHGRIQEPSTGPGAVGYTVQEDPCYYRTFAPGQQVIVYYPSPPPGISPKFHVFWKPFTVVEMVGRVTVKMSQHNKKAIMVRVDRVLQESSTGTGYGAVGYKFQEDPCNYGDPRSRSENQHREMAYQGRNLYGIEEFKWGRSKNKNRHQGDIVVDNSKTRPAKCPSGKAERAVWSALEEDFDEFKWVERRTALRTSARRTQWSTATLRTSARRTQWSTATGFTKARTGARRTPRSTTTRHVPPSAHPARWTGYRERPR